MKQTNSEKAVVVKSAIILKLEKVNEKPSHLSTKN